MSQICPKCKSENIDGAKFCKKCGNALQLLSVGDQTLSDIEQRVMEAKLYEQVATELKNGQKKEGLYTKALVDANGVTEQADLLYIKYAVQALNDEITLKLAKERAYEVNGHNDEKLKSDKIMAAKREEASDKEVGYIVLGFIVLTVVVVIFLLINK